MTTPSNTYTLPDLHSMCPWRASLNPHHAEVAAASSAWALSYDIFKHIPNEKKHDFFLKRGGELLCAYAYPYAAPEMLRTACDFLNLLFTIDEVSDEQDGAGAQTTAESVVRALSDESYDDDSVLCKMTKEYVVLLFLSSPVFLTGYQSTNLASENVSCRSPVRILLVAL